MEQLTHSQFVSEIITLIIFGIVYVAILVYCARRDPSGLPQKRKTLRTVLGVLSLLISAFVLIIVIISLQSGKVNVNPLTELGYNLSRYGTANPSEMMKETGLGANTIYRRSDVPIVWGYPSIFQYVIRSLVLYFFVLLGWGVYLLLFKPSDTTKGRKVFKVIGFILLWITYSGIPSLQYFDFYEIFPFVLFAGLSFLCLFVLGRKKHKETRIIEIGNENNPPMNSIQQDKERLKDIPQKRRSSLFALGFIISIPLMVLAIVCQHINQKDYHNKWDFDYPWCYDGNIFKDFHGLPGLYEFSSYEVDGSLFYYSIPENYDLDALRGWFSDRNDEDNKLPYLVDSNLIAIFAEILQNQDQNDT